MSKIYYEAHMMRIPHTARISNVDSIMFVNRIKEKVMSLLMHKVSGNLKVFLKYMKKFKACVFSGGKSHLLFYKIHTLHFNFVLLIISVLKGANISESLLLIIKF